MRCRRIQNLLSAYLDEELDARQLHRVEAHLGDCPSCRRLLEQLRAAVRLVSGLPREAAPKDLSRSIQEAAERMALLGDQGPRDARDAAKAAEPAIAARRLRRPWTPAAATAKVLAAAAAVLFAVGIGWLAGRMGGQAGMPAPSFAPGPLAQAPRGPDGGEESADKKLAEDTTGKKRQEEQAGWAAKMVGAKDARNGGLAAATPADVGGDKLGETKALDHRLSGELSGAVATEYFFLDAANRAAGRKLLADLAAVADADGRELRQRALKLDAAAGRLRQAAEPADGDYAKELTGSRTTATDREELAAEVVEVELPADRVEAFLRVLDATVSVKLARAEAMWIEKAKQREADGTAAAPATTAEQTAALDREGGPMAAKPSGSAPAGPGARHVGGGAAGSPAAVGTPAAEGTPPPYVYAQDAPARPGQCPPSAPAPEPALAPASVPGHAPAPAPGPSPAAAPAGAPGMVAPVERGGQSGVLEAAPAATSRPAELQQPPAGEGESGERGTGQRFAGSQGEPAPAPLPAPAAAPVPTPVPTPMPGEPAQTAQAAGRTSLQTGSQGGGAAPGGESSRLADEARAEAATAAEAPATRPASRPAARADLLDGAFRKQDQKAEAPPRTVRLIFILRPPPPAPASRP